jgi:hypothetical protein
MCCLDQLWSGSGEREPASGWVRKDKGSNRSKDAVIHRLAQLVTPSLRILRLSSGVYNSRDNFFVLRYGDAPQIGTRNHQVAVFKSYYVSVVFRTTIILICSLLSVVCGSLIPVGLPLELDVQKEERMRALLVLLGFVPHDGQLAIEGQVLIFKREARSTHRYSWPRSS